MERKGLKNGRFALRWAATLACWLPGPGLGLFWLGLSALPISRFPLASSPLSLSLSLFSPASRSASSLFVSLWERDRAGRQMEGRDKREREKGTSFSWALGIWRRLTVPQLQKRLPSNPAPATPVPLSPSLWCLELLTSAPNEGEGVLGFPESGGGGRRKRTKPKGQLDSSEEISAGVAASSPLPFPACLSLFLLLAGARERERKRQREAKGGPVGGVVVLQRQLAYLLGGGVESSFERRREVGGRKSSESF